MFASNGSADDFQFCYWDILGHLCCFRTCPNNFLHQCLVSEECQIEGFEGRQIICVPSKGLARHLCIFLRYS